MLKYDLLCNFFMYVYFPTLRFGEDKVAWATWVNWNTGDLMRLDDNEGIILWERVTCSELIHWNVTVVKSEIIAEQVLSIRAVEQIHVFVWQRFTTYANSIPLWIGNESAVLIKRKSKNKTKTVRSWHVEWFSDTWIIFSTYIWERKQQLLVFPDLRTMHQQTPKRVFEQPWVSRRHAWLTALQKATIFWWVKTGQIHTLITTPAWVFQDWLLLWDIFLIDAHKRRYKSGQDPRYRTPSVCESIQKIYWTQFITSWFKL